MERSIFKTWLSDCFVLSGKKIYSYSVSLHPGVFLSISKLSRKLDKVVVGWGGVRVDLQWTSLLSQGKEGLQYPWAFVAIETGIRSGQMCHFA